MGGSPPFFTVFTPTYNRAHLLTTAYRSLCGQEGSSFEWLVVDDGSTDNTRQLVEQWQQHASFPIRYYYQPNSGKHAAINRAVQLASGELMIILDSDDWLAQDALTSIRGVWESIPVEERERFVGVVGLYAFSDNRVVGQPFPHSPMDTDALELQIRYRVRGDKFGANRVDVLRQFPFPENLGRFVPESLVWNRIASRYKLRCVNQIWAHTQYHSDGLSSRMLQNRVQSSHTARLYYQELFEAASNMNGASTSARVRVGANYVRFSLHTGLPLRQVARDAAAIGVCIASVALGALLYHRDRFLLRDSKG
ncbi:MAG: glycosyltransferase family A protein [Armatimonadota bacterium]|nr:glycosyltransferase family A protein [Armatimonadota bacterium]